MASQDSAGKKDGSRRRRPRGPNHGGRAARARREARRAARALADNVAPATGSNEDPADTTPRTQQAENETRGAQESDTQPIKQSAEKTRREMRREELRSREAARLEAAQREVRRAITRLERFREDLLKQHYPDGFVPEGTYGHSAAGYQREREEAVKLLLMLEMDEEMDQGIRSL
ncbi:hypothetical protein PV08_03688 [Exophiala spinifera]|uniref:Uncharacterized protein n=1 Tax=Exophiala spinifera TaxID=91928 RepID=A0A0D2BKE4_9EURO|nr:uncharacterized protein PV08_03688 [Exophiala spinifera]KIW19393.1 hypothetical protein PV08_03688 [Exophiala spinifera]